MLVLAEMTWPETFTAVALFLVCLLLMLIIMLQKGRGGGLTSAFGGGGGGGGAFGAKTGDVFTGITVVLAGFFLLLTVFGNFVLRPKVSSPQTVVAPAPGSSIPISAQTVPQPAGSPETQPGSADGGAPAASTDQPPADGGSVPDAPEATDVENAPSNSPKDDSSDD